MWGRASWLVQAGSDQIRPMAEQLTHCSASLRLDLIDFHRAPARACQKHSLKHAYSAHCLPPAARIGWASHFSRANCATSAQAHKLRVANKIDGGRER